MDIAYLIQNYGYFAIALGSFLEGEAILLAGSLAAYHGHLDLKWVLPIAAISSFMGDLPYFFAARRYGPAVLKRYPTLECKKDRLDGLLQRHHVLLVLSLRFLYGVRIAGLLSLGLSKMSAARFLCLDFIGAIIWASGICMAGYGIGRLLQRLLAEGVTLELMFMLLVMLVLTSVAILVTRRRKLALSRVQRRQ